MIHEGKEYILIENENEASCEGCPLEELCDNLADDFDITFELCAMEENFGEFEDPIYKLKEDDEENHSR